ncbi:hypothetical protein BDQ12DRAFT_687797 [Crucibulum laeve]|uniref:Uncharacterized protein n=1 Tax=Crucibulum laeve TaxID=68775 RepID=A0A5C3LTG8_9AGAR|nr:hypothetical protein BDQ12DRAFT_687797 [Crucibulum laeve]
MSTPAPPPSTFDASRPSPPLSMPSQQMPHRHTTSLPAPTPARQALTRQRPAPPAVPSSPQH